MPFGLGLWEIAILVGVLAVLFGAKGVPDVARKLAGGLRELRGAMDDADPRRMLEPRREPPPASGGDALPAASAASSDSATR